MGGRGEELARVAGWVGVRFRKKRSLYRTGCDNVTLLRTVKIGIVYIYCRYILVNKYLPAVPLSLHFSRSKSGVINGLIPLG